MSNPRGIEIEILENKIKKLIEIITKGLKDLEIKKY